MAGGDSLPSKFDAGLLSGSGLYSANRGNLKKCIEREKKTLVATLVNLLFAMKHVFQNKMMCFFQLFYLRVSLDTRETGFVNPIPSMYGIFTYIWLICMVNVGIYTIHGCYGNPTEIHPYVFVVSTHALLGLEMP